MRPGLVSISFLPLCHITARHVDFAMLYHGVTLAYCPVHGRLPATLLEVRPPFRGRAPRLRKNLRPGGAERQGHAQARHLRLGRFRGTGSQARNSCRDNSHLAQLEAGQQTRLLENSRGHGRQGRNLHFRRRAPGPRTRRVVRQRWASAFTRATASPKLRQ